MAKENRNQYPTPRKLMRAGGYALGFALAIPAIINLWGDFTAESEGNTERDANTGELVHDIGAISLLDGARVRFSPRVHGDGETPDNMAGTFDASGNGQEKLDVPTPDGVRVFNEGRNGIWYGISVENIKQATAIIGKPDLLGGVNNDRSGVVWVNNAKAVATYGTPQSGDNRPY